MATPHIFAVVFCTSVDYDLIYEKVIVQISQICLPMEMKSVSKRSLKINEAVCRQRPTQVWQICSAGVLILGVFGWLKASRQACFSSHRITVHVLLEQYFSLITISWNSIFQSCRTGPLITGTTVCRHPARPVDLFKNKIKLPFLEFYI